jgi:hypothetical protein
MSNILDNISGTKDRRYSIVYGISQVGSTSRTVISFIDAPDEYRPSTDILVFVCNVFLGASALDDNALTYSPTHDAETRYTTGPGTGQLVGSKTNLRFFGANASEGGDFAQIMFGNPVFPILQDDARAVAAADSGSKIINTWLVLRKSVNGQYSGDSWRDSQLSGFAISSDSIPPGDDSDSGYNQKPAVVKENQSTLITTSPSINNVRGSQNRIPFTAGTSGRSYLAIAVATSTNSALTGIDWGFPEGDTYSSGLVGTLYTVIKVVNMTFEEYVDGSIYPVSVNGKTNMIGTISINIGELNN